MKVERFEDLTIWKQGRVLVGEIYKLFESGSRGESDFGFKSQITRAAVSVMNNIAEGFERDGDVEFAHFLSLAKASAGEVRSMLYLAEDLFYTEAVKAESLRREYEELSRGIATLAVYLKK